MAREYSEQMLDEMYHEVEAVTTDFVNRGDLITVDGRTIHEIMAEEYAKADRDPEMFEKFYEEHVRQETNRLVQEALHAGKYVEMFRTDRTGALLEGQEQLVTSAMEPAQPDRENEQKIAESRERVKYINCVDRHKIDKSNLFRFGEYFGDWMEEHGAKTALDIHHAIDPNPRGFTTDREALPTFAVIAMFAEGHTIDAIGDPAQLRAEKQQIGREVIEHLQAQDYGWLADKMVIGQKRLLDQLDEKLHQLNLSDCNQLEKPEYLNLFFIAKRAFDISQENGRMREELKESAKKIDPEHPEQLLEDNLMRSSTLPALFDVIRGGMLAKVELSYGARSKSRAGSFLQKIIEGENVKNIFNEKHQEAPQEAYSHYINSEEMPMLVAYGTIVESKERDYEKLEKLLKYPSVSRMVGGKLLSGNVQDYMDISMKLEGEELKATFRVDPGLVEQMQPLKTFDRENTSFHQRYPDELAASIRELKEADPIWLFGSRQYKDMQESAENLAATMRNFQTPYTYPQVHVLQEMIGNFRQSIVDYQEYKKEHHTGSKQEQKRTQAASKILQLSERMLDSIRQIDQCYDVIPELHGEKQRTQEIVRENERAETVEQVKEAQPLTVSQEITNCLERKYGKDAPAVYHAKGSMVEVKQSGEEQPQRVNVIDQLNGDILKHSRDLSVGVEWRSLTKDAWGKLIRTMGRMVAVENIVMERASGNYKDGMETVEPGPFEKACAKDPRAVLHGIMHTDAFKSLSKKLMDPGIRGQVIKDFIMNDGARKLAREIQAEAKEAGKNKEQEVPVNQRSSRLEKKEPQKQPPQAGL